MRLGSLLGALTVAVLLLANPSLGLFVMWRVVIPSLPVLFLVAPGLWRNLCPLAAANQTPRALGITRGRPAPPWLREYGYVIAFSLFIAFVTLRRLGMDRSGLWSAVLLIGALGSAFTGGMLLKGKSGWCSSICPLLPVQRIYGQTPLVTIANSHCQPCVGCTKHCYDFNPRSAYLADLNDGDGYWSGYRRWFVGAFPGLVLSFFTVRPGPPLHVLGMIALYLALSTSLFGLLSTFVKTSPHTLTSLFGAIAFTTFYWFAGAFGPAELTWLIRLAALTLALTWFVRTRRNEPAYLATITPAAGTPPETTGGGAAGITFLPSQTHCAIDPGTSLLDLAERERLPLEAGCRMGICGADPVAIVDGADCTSPIGDEERKTLARLGLGGSARLACCVRVSGPVTVDLRPEATAAQASQPTFECDQSIEHVVIIGNGIAGVTAAEQLRRHHPDVEIILVVAESHHLYNRMGIARLVYGRSAMQGLYLKSPEWYADRRITTWLNTRATAIDRMACEVQLGTGERLAYDRLILATGSSSRVPPVGGFGLPGSAVLRSADDALALRAYIQRRQARRAVVAGGGLLGLEAAHALGELGLETVVLERSERLLRRQLDERAAELLRRHLEDLGVRVAYSSELAQVRGGERVEELELRDGRRVPADIVLIAAGNAPNVDLARAAELPVDRGIRVDDHMRTADPRVYAVGDAAECDGEVIGLWSAATDQAEVAAENVAGGNRSYAPVIPATTLKVAGIDLTSIGRFEPSGPAEEAIVLEDTATGRYEKLVMARGTPVGAIMLGAGGARTAAARTAIVEAIDLGTHLDELRAGRWDCLDTLS